MTSGDAILSVRSVSASYGGVPVLRDVSLDVGEGELVALIGPNGAGKTTLYNVICGVVRPDSGRIYFMGRDITGLPPERICRMGIALLPQGRGLFPSLSVRDNLLLGAWGLDGRQLRDRLESIYSVFPALRGKEKRRVGSLSGGEQQMVAIARALISRPKVLMLDEPSAGLAPITMDNLYNSVIARLRGTVSMVITEHRYRRLLEIADRWYVMEGGSVVMEGGSGARRSWKGERARAPRAGPGSAGTPSGANRAPRIKAYRT
jgi:branched-chain amino acid transport system ATP-binding protein